jgi:hypothetical protein
VSSTSRGERLIEKHNLTLVLRLVVDQGRQLVHGELVGPDGTSRGRFADWGGLTRVIKGWLADPEGGAPTDAAGA